MPLKKFDLVDLLALALFAVGAGLFAWGYFLDPPASYRQLVLNHFGDWTPGFVVDGILLFVLNRVIHANERRRIISQVASLSNEFALDAVRRCREEKWLQSGTLEKMEFAKARLSTADLSDAMLAGVDLSFADLTGADLTNADLSGANLKGTNLADADLRWANLTGADLQWADLRNAQLDGANLSGIVADFASVDAQNAEIPEFQKAVIDGFLSARQIGLVKASFELLLVEGSPAIVRFYERLFDTAPQFRQLFSSDVERQARKFLQSIKLIVSSLSSMERAAPVLNRLGSRHHGYGVEPGDYDVVGGVLVDTLQEVLGDKFTEEVKVAWIAAFGLISTAMISAYAS
jgi:nitric oxide dioxygenase